jgi:hypothetical protein
MGSTVNQTEHPVTKMKKARFNPSRDIVCVKTQILLKVLVDVEVVFIKMKNCRLVSVAVTIYILIKEMLILNLG